MIRVVPLVGLLAGCGEPLTPQSQVDKLRVLAMRADRPEVGPGETVTVDVLWADPKGDGRDVWFVWAACTVGPGADPRACGPEGEDVQLLGIGIAAQTVTFDVAPDALAGRDEAMVLVTVLLCADDLPDVEEGCPGESVVAYKRITVSSGRPPNRNPRIASVSLGGLELSDRDPIDVPVCPGGGCPGYELVVVADAGSAETYVAPTPEGEAEATEELIVSYFATGGEFSQVRAIDPDNEDFRVAWRAPRDVGDLTFWVVLRDDRGGITWTAREADVE
jgi:hypothetical protein